MGFNKFNNEYFGDEVLATRLNSEKRLGRYVRTEVADVDFTAGTRDHLIAYTSLSAGRTVSLPAASSLKVGDSYIVKDESGGASSNNIVIDPDGSETIDGAATFTISADYGRVEIYTDGSNWFILED